jgi:hypothetical protein
VALSWIVHLDPLPDARKEAISTGIPSGKLVDGIIETKTIAILQFFQGLNEPESQKRSAKGAPRRPICTLVLK